MWFQSTHSLRSATQQQTVANSSVYVSIHALLAECDPAAVDFFKYFTVSIHALLAECDRYASATGNIAEVSIHALLAECDINNLSPIFIYQKFQSTHSLRSATKYPRTSRHPGKSFNPRTPCGVRPSASLIGYTVPGFNPRTPCGVRRQPSTMPRPKQTFQSTHSLRSATADFVVEG